MHSKTEPQRLPLQSFGSVFQAVLLQPDRFVLPIRTDFYDRNVPGYLSVVNVFCHPDAAFKLNSGKFFDRNHGVIKFFFQLGGQLPVQFLCCTESAP
jgi:hypothetical protein